MLLVDSPFNDIVFDGDNDGNRAEDLLDDSL
jgi:hypothetical protein